jgi:hypothetical protein
MHKCLSLSVCAFAYKYWCRPLPVINHIDRWISEIQVVPCLSMYWTGLILVTALQRSVLSYKYSAPYIDCVLSGKYAVGLLVKKFKSGRCGVRCLITGLLQRRPGLNARPVAYIYIYGISCGQFY